MALIVMGSPLGLAGLHRQQRLCAVERLYLGFLIDAQHHGAIWRIEVEPDDVAHLLDEQRIARQLEGLAAMGLQPVGLPDAVDGRRRMTNCFRHAAQAPVRSPRRPAFERSTDRVGDLVVANLARCARPRLVIQPIQPKSCEPLSPFANRPAENAQPFRDFAVMPARCRRQHNARSQRQRLAGRVSARQRFQFAPLFRRQLNRGCFALCHAADLLNEKIRMSRISRSGH
jgi:hypothetical protein